MKGSRKEKQAWLDLAFDELNLCEIPLGGVGGARGKRELVFRDTIRDKKVGRDVSRSFRLRPCTYALRDWQWAPTWKDVDILLALLKLMYEATGFECEHVSFRLLDLWQTLGRPKAKNRRRECRRLCESLVRWSKLVIEGNAWRVADRWESVCFAPISGIARDQKASADLELIEYRVSVAPQICNSLELGYKRGFDWNFYLSLKRPTSKRLYRFLGKRFYWNGQVQFPLEFFAREKMGMCRSREPREYKYGLRPAIEELERRGYLVPLASSDRYEKKNGVYHVRFHAEETRRRMNERAASRDKNRRGLRFEPVRCKAKSSLEESKAERERLALIGGMSVELSRKLLEEALNVAPNVLTEGYRRTKAGGGPKHEAYREQLLSWQLSQTG